MLYTYNTYSIRLRSRYDFVQDTNKYNQVRRKTRFKFMHTTISCLSFTTCRVRCRIHTVQMFFFLSPPLSVDYVQLFVSCLRRAADHGTVEYVIMYTYLFLEFFFSYPVTHTVARWLVYVQKPAIIVRTVLVRLRHGSEPGATCRIEYRRSSSL